MMKFKLWLWLCVFMDTLSFVRPLRERVLVFVLDQIMVQISSAELRGFSLTGAPRGRISSAPTEQRLRKRPTPSCFLTDQHIGRKTGFYWVKETPAEPKLFNLKVGREAASMLILKLLLFFYNCSIYFLAHYTKKLRYSYA